MAIQAIHKATQRGSISTSNAAIVLMVLQDGHAVRTIARKLNLTSGAIHYHINQVRATLPAIVANIEEPGFCSKPKVSEGQLWQLKHDLQIGTAKHPLRLLSKRAEKIPQAASRMYPFLRNRTLGSAADYYRHVISTLMDHPELV